MATEKHRQALCAQVVRVLSEERKRQGISMNVLAQRAGLSQSLISTLESNPWNPTLDTLLRISEVLNVRLGDVINCATETLTKSTEKQ